MLGDSLLGAGYAALSWVAPAVADAPEPSRESELRSLLAKNHRLSPDFRGGLSNHLSMGLYSLVALGGSRAELTRFADGHFSSLEPLPKEFGPVVSNENWSQRLADRGALNGFRAFFADSVARAGREATLKRYLPGLLPGIAGGAFHPLIRTAYGIRFGDDHEVIDGLAYWATAFLPLGPLGRPGRERDPSLILAKVSEERSLAGRELGGHLIMGRMRSASELPGFARAVDSLAPTDTTLSGLASSSLRLYLQSGDFTALHAVTGTHAYRQVAPFIEPPADGVRYLWQALVAAYLSVGAPRVVEPESSDAPPWPTTVARALASLDAHDLKLVEVAREEERYYSEPLYRRAAARRMRLI
jgi:hypothetical protein